MLSLGRKTKRLWLEFCPFYLQLLHPILRKVKVNTIEIIISDPNVLPPLSSSETLLFDDVRGKTVLDVGTGCGIIALTAKKLGAKYVLGVDINKAAISNAKTNLKNNFPDQSGIEFRHSDLYESVTSSFDIIITNPPYFRDLPITVSDYNYCGGDILERLLNEGKQYLAPGGEIRVLHPSSAKSYMIDLAKKYDYRLNFMTHVTKTDNLWRRLLLGQVLRPQLKIYTFKSNSERELAAQ